MLLCSLAAAFTTNLQADQSKANGNAFIITNTFIATAVITAYISNNSNNNKTIHSVQRKTFPVLGLIVVILVSGWLLKKHCTARLTPHIQGKQQQNLVMVVLSTLSAFLGTLLVGYTVLGFSYVVALTSLPKKRAVKETLGSGGTFYNSDPDDNIKW